MHTVFHHARRDQAAAALANVENLLDVDNVDVETVSVVVNGDAVHTLTRGSEHADRVLELAEADGVEFLACSNSLESRDISADDLLAGVDTVPAGIGAIVRLQHEGYAYVKD